MKDIARTAARRAAGTVYRFTLTRDGHRFCLAVGAIAHVREGRVDARIIEKSVGSAALARKVEAGFWRWLEIAPVLLAEPETALGVAIRYADYLEPLEREFRLQQAANPSWTQPRQVQRAVEVFDAGLSMAHRRLGRRWV